MILPKLPLLLATAAASASVASGAELTGYLMDRLCVGNCVDKTGGCNPDGSNSFFTPQDHTGWCLLLPYCISSGYMLMSESTDADGKHSIIANFTDAVSNEAVVQYINATSDGGKRVQFPLVTIVHADDAVVVESDGTRIVQVSNAEIKDPWPTTAYDGADTTQVIISSASDANIALNNMGFRSDVRISKNDAKGMYVIESNGCPDHESMSGGSAGVIANSQAEPGTDICSAAGEGTCGTCGNGCEGKSGCAGGCSACAGKSGCTGGNSGCAGKSGCAGGNSGCAGGNSGCAGGNSGCAGQSGCTGGNSGCAGQSGCTGGNSGCAGQSGCAGGNSGCAGQSGCAGGCGNRNLAGCGSCGSCASYCAGDCGAEDCSGCASCGAGDCGPKCGGSCDHTHGPYDPMYQHYTMMIPQAPGTLGDATPISDDVVGIMSNGVLLDSHSQTWSYDECNGHSDKKHQYHYHIPPICYLKSMGVTFPLTSSWWMNDAGDEVRPYEEMASQFPAKGSSPVVGFARDGYPIYALYDPAGDLQSSSLYDGELDECNGKDDGNGYAYYITAHPPFAPKCLRGNIGSFSYATTEVACPKAGIKNSIEAASVPQETPAPSPSSGNRAMMPLLIALAPAMTAIASYLF